MEEVLEEEKREKILNNMERDVTRSENMMAHEKEIAARPKRTWFESEREKRAAHEKGSKELNGPVPGIKVRGEGKKLSHKEKKRLDAKDEFKDGRTWKKNKEDAQAIKAAPSKLKNTNGLKRGEAGKKPTARRPGARAGDVRKSGGGAGVGKTGSKAQGKPNFKGKGK